MAFRDRGEARFRFVGREDLREEFASYLTEARDARRGSTYVIQGPPGAGKTALWHQLVTEAEGKGWNCAEIYPVALHSPTAMAEKTGLDATVGESEESSMGSGAGLKLVVLEGQVQQGHSTAKAHAGTSMDSLLRKLGQREGGTLLIMDEAQKLGHVHEGHRESVEHTLQTVHEGACGGPVVFLATGLGNTEDALHGLGISRFPRRSIVNLGRLIDQDALKMLDEYLTEGGTRRMPTGSEKLTRHVLARCHGWPQHIVAYGDAALDVLSQKGGKRVFTEPDCQAILREGDRDRREYYAGRCSGERDAEITLREVALFGALTQNARKTDRWDRDILDSIAAGANLRPGAVVTLVERAVAKGVLTQSRADREYYIPIPSMSEWLVEQYKRYKRKHPDIAANLDRAVNKALPSLSLFQNGALRAKTGLDSGGGWER